MPLAHGTNPSGGAQGRGHGLGRQPALRGDLPEFAQTANRLRRSVLPRSQAVNFIKQVKCDLAAAQPNTVILELFKVATQIKQYKDRIVLHLPSAYPFKHLLHTLTERLHIPRPPAFNST